MLGPSLLIIIAVAFQTPQPPPTKPSDAQAEARLPNLFNILAPELAPPTPPRPVITDAESWLRKLEQETQSIRDEVRRQLDDAAVVPGLAVEQVRSAWLKASLAREVAEYALKEYVQGQFPLDTVEAKGDIEVAQSDLTRAQEQLAERQKAVDQGQELAGYPHWYAKLIANRAEFELDKAQSQLVILEKYTRPKEIKQLEAQLEHARQEEDIKKMAYDHEILRLKRRQAASARLRARTPEDLVVAMLDDVVQDEGRIVDLTRELTAIRAEQAADLDHPATYSDRIKANRDAVANAARRIKEDLTLATTVAEEVRQARDRLFKAEKRLIVARRDLDRGAK